jgi:molybdopterin/thiamine biosynthesis adenylyltransferase
MLALDRYARQVRFAPIGAEGQRRIREARLLLVGCGALGSALAEIVVRAGVGALTVVDRDLVDESNLQRQSLFDEDDARQGRAKAAAAEARLRRINSDVRIDGVVRDVTARNVDELVRSADLVLDGTDNLEARFFLNEIGRAHV